MLLNLLVGAFGLFAVVFLFRGLRRRGTLVVTVKYDTTAESGLFSLMLARRRKDMTLKGGDEGAYADAVRKGGTKIGKRSASMIKPVTTFEGLPLGRFYVYLYGVYIRLGRPDGNYVIEKECVIRNRETTMVDFDLVGDNATVLVDVWEGDGAVPKVLVTVNNDMDHGIYTGDRGGGAVFLLKPGEYEIQAAKGNKSARMTVRCEHPRPYHFTMRFDEGDETMAPRRATARPPEDDIAFMPPQDSDDFDLR